MRPVLVVGPPRSGTTWVEGVLGLAGDTASVNEPDNETQHPFALRAKRSLGRFPVLDAGDDAPADYRRLWEGAFSGGLQPRTIRWAAAKALLKLADKYEFRAALCEYSSPRLSAKLRIATALAAPPVHHGAVPNVIVKSVHSAFSIPWIAEGYNPQVVVVLRHPFNVVASWAELGWGAAGGCSLYASPRVRRRYLEPLGIPLPRSQASSLELLTWQIGVLTCALEANAAAHPDWIVVSHEELCADPVGGFTQLFERLQLEWTDRAGAFLESTRLKTGAQPERWRSRLSAGQVEEIRGTLENFPLQRRPDELAL